MQISLSTNLTLDVTRSCCSGLLVRNCLLLYSEAALFISEKFNHIFTICIHNCIPAVAYFWVVTMKHAQYNMANQEYCQLLQQVSEFSFYSLLLLHEHFFVAQQIYS